MKRFYLGAMLLLGVLGSYGVAFGADVGTGMAQGQGGYYDPADRSGPYSIGPDGTKRLLGQTNSTASNDSTAAATGTQSDPATAGGANTTIVGALRAIRDKLLTNVAAITFVFDGVTNRQLASTTTGALAPPTAASGKIIDTSVSLAASTSTTLVAARATSGDRISIEIQCDGTAAVGIDMKGGTLTSATAAPRVIPSGSYPLYTPPVATQTAITAYTGTAQTCRVAEYIR